MGENVFYDLQKKLMFDEKYSVFDSATMTANILTGFDEKIKETIVAWSKGEDVTGYTMEASTVQDVMDSFGCSAFQALCFMNALCVDEDIYMNALLRDREDEVR